MARSALFFIAILLFSAVTFAETHAQKAIFIEQDNCSIETVKDPQEIDQWRSRVVSHIHRFVEYPKNAQDRHDEGTAVVAFEIDRTGRVLDANIEQSSKSKLLDDAAIKAIQRASPIPGVPVKMTNDKLPMVAPISFRQGQRGPYPPCQSIARAIRPIFTVTEADGQPPLAPKDRALLQDRLGGCWTADPMQRVALRLRLNRDGTFKEPPSAEKRPDQDNLAASLAAVGLMKCDPIQLTAENYESWREIVIAREPGIAENKTSTDKTKSPGQARR